MSITTASVYSSPSSQDPSGQGGFTGAGNLWAQTDTGLWFVRNSANTNWTLIGSGDQASFGLYSLAGGAGSGAITGDTGLMTADGSTPFAISPTVTNRNSPIATLADLATMQSNLQTLINETVAQSIAGIPVPGVNSSIIISSGTIGPGATYNTTLSLPYQGLVYPDGTAVALADCYGFASHNTVYLPGTNNNVYLLPQDSRGMTWWCYASINLSTNIPFIANYQIIAIKPNT